MRWFVAKCRPCAEMEIDFPMEHLHLFHVKRQCALVCIEYSSAPAPSPSPPPQQLLLQSGLTLDMIKKYCV